MTYVGHAFSEDVPLDVLSNKGLHWRPKFIMVCTCTVLPCMDCNGNGMQSSKKSLR